MLEIGFERFLCVKEWFWKITWFVSKIVVKPEFTIMKKAMVFVLITLSDN